MEPSETVLLSNGRFQSLRCAQNIVSAPAIRSKTEGKFSDFAKGEITLDLIAKRARRPVIENPVHNGQNETGCCPVSALMITA
jgi:hypothetical protein